MRSIFQQFLSSRTAACLLFLAMAVGNRTTGQEPKAGNDTVHRVETGLRALSTEGCYRREPIWEGELTRGKRLMLPFFFFRENQYVLVIAADDTKTAEAALNIEVLDLMGIPIACHTGAGKGRIVVAARPVTTGTCYLSFTLPEGARPLKLAVGCAYR